MYTGIHSYIYIHDNITIISCSILLLLISHVLSFESGGVCRLHAGAGGGQEGRSQVWALQGSGSLAPGSPCRQHRSQPEADSAGAPPVDQGPVPSCSPRRYNAGHQTFCLTSWEALQAMTFILQHSKPPFPLLPPSNLSAGDSTGVPGYCRSFMDASY